MKKRNKTQSDAFFQNLPSYFEQYQGKMIAAEDIKLTDFTGLKVAVIGANQLSVSNLDSICEEAEFVKVFQIAPHFVLPNNEKGIHRLVSHPLIVKNRRLFNNRIKSLIAIRYLDSQVKDEWLKRQLMPNSANENKVFYKSDRYYTALQRKNCKLITWPIVKITTNAIQSMEGVEHIVDVIVTTHSI